jgi:hypothetical protein
VRSLNAAYAKKDLFKMRGLVVRLYSHEVSHIYRMVLTADTSPYPAVRALCLATARSDGKLHDFLRSDGSGLQYGLLRTRC